MRWIAWGKKLFLCLAVLVLRGLLRRPEQSKEGVCWMWEVQSDLLTLDKYSSWRVGRVVAMIRSAVQTTLCRLLWSDLVAELNQTVIDVQRTDSMMAE